MGTRTWSMASSDRMLPGPPSRNNGGSADCSPSGLLAYGAGSSIVVADPRSMQLVCVLPMPPASSSSSGPTAHGSLAPFVTSVRWTPQALYRRLSEEVDEDPSNSHLRLAAGDRQGRIAIWDLRSRQVVLWLELDTPASSAPASGPAPAPAASSSRLGIQDLCWVRSDPWLLAAIHGPSLLVLWSTSSNCCLWKYDASPEYLSCIRRDPFDWRHFCTLGLRGLLLSAISLGGSDVSVQQQWIPLTVNSSDLQKLEKELTSANSASSPAHALFPSFFSRMSFSPRWRHILLITFPKELVSFDLLFGTMLSSTPVPRGCGKFMDLLPDPDLDLLYCIHLDGKLSTWKRKERAQFHIVCEIEELMPAIGTAIPTPAVLAVTLVQSESAVQTICKLCTSPTMIQSSFTADHALPKIDDETNTISKTCFISISDDGKVWNWLLTCDKEAAAEKDASMKKRSKKPNELPALESTQSTDSSFSQGLPDIVKADTANGSFAQFINPSITEPELFTKISLISQLHLLSSTLTTLAVPSPSLIATLARGGSNPAPAVPLVALGTQNGTIDVIDVSANAVAVSFSVHTSAVRGLRWLGNSRLVSFSYIQVNEKGGGYTNKLAVACLRSGLNRRFRVLQKPEKTTIRALKASSSGRYLLILFRDAPVEVWAMTKTPIMLRSLALPFTVVEWTLPSAPRPNQNESSRQSFSNEPTPTTPSASESSKDSKTGSSESPGDDTSESFSFALVNGALGVFEVHGRRIRDFRPKWPSSSFVSSDGLITAMAYRLPHVVMGDRLGNIRWWDVTTGYSSSFNTHREGIRRIKFSPVVSGDRSIGRIAVLFYDNTFSIFDLDTSDPLANGMLQPQSPGTLVLELDWLPIRMDKYEPLTLCIAGADSSFRLIEVNVTDGKNNPKLRIYREKFRPMPLCLPMLLPGPHALALRMVLQVGVKPSWFSSSATTDVLPSLIAENAPASVEDLRSFMIESTLPYVGDAVVPELLLKVLEPYRKEGCIFDDERARLYASIVSKGAASRFAFTAAIFGEVSEALFWLQLPHAICHLVKRSISKSRLEVPSSSSVSESESSILHRIASRERSVPGTSKQGAAKLGQLNLMTFKPEELLGNAIERIPWHERLDGEEAIQKRVHELISVGDLEAAVSLLLSTPPEGSHFYTNALRAVALSASVSRSLHELAVKVVAANLVRTDKSSLSGIHLLCAVGKYQEACSQLQDAGRWIDAATLAATHLHGSDYSRVLQRWADYILHTEQNVWRALILYVAAGALTEAIAALRYARQEETAAMFIIACHEIYAEASTSESSEAFQYYIGDQCFRLPSRNFENGDLAAVNDFFGEYQRKLIHLCMDSVAVFD